MNVNNKLPVQWLSGVAQNMTKQKGTVGFLGGYSTVVDLEIQPCQNNSHGIMGQQFQVIEMQSLHFVTRKS